MAHSRATRNAMIEMHKKPKHWIQQAINPETKGSLHKALGVAQDKKIPEKKLEKATHSKNLKVKREAILDKTLRKFH